MLFPSSCLAVLFSLIGILAAQRVRPVLICNVVWTFAYLSFCALPVFVRSFDPRAVWLLPPVR